MGPKRPAFPLLSHRILTVNNDRIHPRKNRSQSKKKTTLNSLPKELWGKTDSISTFSHPKATLNLKDQNDRKLSKEKLPNQKPQRKSVSAQVRLSLKVTGKMPSISPFFSHLNLMPYLQNQNDRKNPRKFFPMENRNPKAIWLKQGYPKNHTTKTASISPFIRKPQLTLNL